MSSKNEVVTIKHEGKFKRNRRKKYSVVNVVSILQSKYFGLYENLCKHTEGCLSGGVYKNMDNLLIEDYINSINNLENLSKKSMKYFKNKDKKERRRISWYKFRRFFHLCKKNAETESLIKKRDKFAYEMAKLFEDPLSSSVRLKLEAEETSIKETFLNDEPDYVSDVDELIEGNEATRVLTGTVLDNESLLDFNREEK